MKKRRGKQENHRKKPGQRLDESASGMYVLQGLSSAD